MALIATDLPELTFVSKGKVRDIYSTSSPNHLLFVATDRISAYDVILQNGIPEKGKLLTKISCFWFEKLKDIIPNHFVTADMDEMPHEVKLYRDQLEGRTMLVRKAKVVQLEAIVRGYITGSAWSEYKKSGTVHGISLPEGLIESQRLPEPLFTPSTKAEQGAHDENISPDEAAKIIGPEIYNLISKISLELYKRAAEHAYSRGVILADTKFEFGLVPSSDLGPAARSELEVNGEHLILVDEVLTPDSSRYWPLASYTPGQSQPSFDKQFVRDWLVKSGFKKGFESGPPGHEGEGWKIDEDVVSGTRERYEEAVRLLMV
ncbi:hypothetical protein ONZ45_g6820 [Pleurotus djamor]|nr:hypothetical protein ONZ45_g6820 [Pleurotus djamor]